MTLGEKKIGINFNNSADTMTEVLKHQAAEWINIAETFKIENPSEKKDRLIESAQDILRIAVQLLVKATDET